MAVQAGPRAGRSAGRRAGRRAGRSQRTSHRELQRHESERARGRGLPLGQWARLGAALGLALLLASTLGMSCKKPLEVTIGSPAHGSFTTAGQVAVSGEVRGGGKLENIVLTVNGTAVPVNPDRTWSTTVSLDTAEVFQPVLAEATNAAGKLSRDRVVVHYGESRADGALSEESVALRLNDSGLDAVEPLVSGLVDLDLATLLPTGTTVIDGFCAVDGGFLGCLGRVDVSVASPEPSFSSFGLDVDSMSGFAAGDVTVNDIRVDLDIDGSGVAPSCGLRVTASQVSILGDYGLDPSTSDPTQIDVNLLSPPAVTFTSFNDEFTSGLCDFPLIGDLIQLIIGDIQPVVTDGLRDFLDDPDGGGPADSPIADGIEVALEGIQIAGPIGEALGVLLDAPLFQVVEDVDGITLGSDGAFVADVGTGPGQCPAPEGAPDLAASYHIDEPFPTFGPTTPAGGLPYGLGLSVSSSAFNQLLKSQVECGLLTVTLTELSLAPMGDPVPITSDLLALFVPEFSSVEPGTPMRIDIRPSLAPVVTGEAGANGELTQLEIAGLEIEVRTDEGTDALMLGGRVDTELGLDLAFDAGSLLFQLGDPTAELVDVTILENPLGTNAAALEDAVLPAVIATFLPDLASDLAAFPLPEFLGLNLDGVEVSRQGAFLSLYADLTPSSP